MDSKRLRLRSLESTSPLAALSTTSLIVSESRKDMELFSTCSGSEALSLVTAGPPPAPALALPALLSIKARDMISRKMGIPFCVERSSHSCSWLFSLNCVMPMDRMPRSRPTCVMEQAHTCIHITMESGYKICMHNTLTCVSQFQRVQAVDALPQDSAVVVL